MADASEPRLLRWFTASGFRGGINYYRNFHRNWETTPQLAGAQVQQPALFIAGDQDVVIMHASAEQLAARMAPAVPDHAASC